MKRLIIIGAAMVGIVLDGPAEEITGTRDLAGASASWSSLTGSGTLSNSSSTLSVVTLTGSEDATFNGTITGNIRLVKQGSGVQTISQENAGYTGGTYVEGGTLSALSLNHLGAQGSMNASPERMVFLKNGATLRLTGGTQSSPLSMNQGLEVPSGQTGTLEVLNGISKGGSLVMTNATLTLTGGGLMRLASWFIASNAQNGRLVVTNATLLPASGGALGGNNALIPGYVVEVREGGVVQMPADGAALPEMVLAGGRVVADGVTPNGNTSGQLETMTGSSTPLGFKLGNSGLTVKASASPSVISARRIAISRAKGNPFDIAVEDGAELDVSGMIEPFDAASEQTFKKSGGGTLRLDCPCEMAGLDVTDGVLALTPQTAFAAGFVLNSADGTTIRLADGTDAAPGMALSDAVVATADVWIDAAQIRAAEGASVSSPANLGSVGGAFRSSNAPTWTADGIGGKPALCFNGTQALLFDGYTNKTDSLTTFVVMQPTNHVKWTTPISLCSVNPSISTSQGAEEQVTGSFFYSFNGDTISSFKAARGKVGSSTTSWAFEYSLASYGLDKPLLLEHCRNGSTGTGTAYYGEAYDASVKTNKSGWLQQNIERVCIGGRLYANGTPYANRLVKGKIAEVIVFTRALSPAEYAHVETYLKNKYFGTTKTLPSVGAMETRPRVNVEVAAGATARFSPNTADGTVGGTFVKTGNGTLLAGDFRAAAALEAQAGTLALQTVDVASQAAIWIDPSDDDTVTTENGIVTSIANKGTLGGSFTKNLGNGATLLSGGNGINGNTVLSFNKDGTLIYTGFVREDSSVPRSLHVYAVVSRRSYKKFTSPFSFAHTGDSGNDKVANANFHYEEHDANGGCYRTFYGYDARGLTNGTAGAGNYFCDLPRRDSDGEAYISVNRMGSNWQLTATELAGDDPASVPWYATWNCTLKPLHVNRVSLGASMNKGGVATGEGGYWDGRIGEFIVFDNALSVEDETALLAYLRKKWMNKGGGSTTPPECLAGASKTTALHDQLFFATGENATLRHASAPMTVGSLSLHGTAIERTPLTSDGASFALFTVFGDVGLDGALSLSAAAFPREDVPLITYSGDLSDSAAWTLTGPRAETFKFSHKAASKVYWLKRQKGISISIR